MFTKDDNFSVFLENEETRTFLETYAPNLLEPQAVAYIAGFPLSQIRAMLPPEQQMMIDGLLDLANGKTPEGNFVDPRTLPATIKVGVMSEGYDIDDVDGAVYMLDHAFSGCIVMQFSKKMREDILGSVTWQGQPRPFVFHRILAAGDALMLGVYVRDICKDYDTEYTLHVEGFVDEDGIMIAPTDVTFRTDPCPAIDPAYAEHEKVALEAAREGIVLLHNNGVLPLQDNTVYVSGAENFRISAVGAGKINPRYTVGIMKAADKAGMIITEKADTALIVISRASGENYDNNAAPGEYYLSSVEEEEVRRLRANYRHVIAVINSGYPMDVRFIRDFQLDAAVWCGFAGMLGGQALLEVLTGFVNPSGKLPDTWSLDYWDHPSAKNFYQPETPEQALDADHDVWVNTVYKEDIYIGYRYFETFEKEVAYPFGFGLSYTDFEINSETSFTGTPFTGLSLKVRVRNIGGRSGKEVVQVYAKLPEAELEQPSKRLVAFAKTKELEPYEEEELTLSIPAMLLSSFTENGAAWVMEKGTYRFFIGNSVRALSPAGSFELDETKVLRKVEHYCLPNITFDRLSRHGSSYPTGELSGIVEGIHEILPKRCCAAIKESNVPHVTEADDWSVREMARLSVCASAGWGMHQKGEAGKFFRIDGRNIPYYACADGNSGVNVRRKNIGMPSSNMVCASWNTDLAYEIGQVIAEEAKENDIQMILAPALNIHRNPLCGRHPEYFSEDPLLAGKMAGYQCKGLEDNGISACIKHVACNNSESSRKRNQSIVSERALREIYLKAFEVALDIHKPDSIMTGYNALNGRFTAEDEELIQGIFRNEFGFEGYVMTDWNSYDTADIPTAIQAGNCWMTPGSEDNTFVDQIVSGVEDGRISVERLRNNVRYMLHVIRKRTEN